jgi:hypothetical protein
LINTPGLYNLKGIAIEVHESQAGGNGCGTFLSLLPLVIKPFQKGDKIVNAAGSGKNSGGKPRFTVVDSCGVAVFIGPGGLIQCREALTAGKYWVVKISVNGSIDVKRTE